jgi:hypothetical protein
MVRVDSDYVLRNDGKCSVVRLPPNLHRAGRVHDDISTLIREIKYRGITIESQKNHGKCKFRNINTSPKYDLTTPFTQTAPLRSS